jgi:hypothetical protein
MTAEIPTLTKRKLQAQVIGPIYPEMVAQIGEERAALILDSAIRKAAVAEGQYLRRRWAARPRWPTSSNSMKIGPTTARWR